MDSDEGDDDNSGDNSLVYIYLNMCSLKQLVLSSIVCVDNVRGDVFTPLSSPLSLFFLYTYGNYRRVGEKQNIHLERLMWLLLFSATCYNIKILGEF